MATYHPFPRFPEEMRLKIYENILEPRIFQLGVDAGIPIPPTMDPLGTRELPTNKLHTRIPSLFAVCKESRELCKFIFVAFGPTFIHPRLDTLFISNYAVERMRWAEKPKVRRMRHGIIEVRVPGKWPVTDYAEFFRYFGAPREVLIVTNGLEQFVGFESQFIGWWNIELVATDFGIGDQKNLVEFFRGQLPASLSGGGMKITVVGALKEGMVLLSCPYYWVDFEEQMVEKISPFNPQIYTAL